MMITTTIAFVMLGAVQLAGSFVYNLQIGISPVAGI
jgi:hypothetical protein